MEMLFPSFVSYIVSFRDYWNRKALRENAIAVHPLLSLYHILYSFYQGLEVFAYLCLIVFDYLLDSNSVYHVLYLLCVTPHKLRQAPLSVASSPAVVPCRWLVAPLIIPITLCRWASEGSSDM